MGGSVSVTSSAEIGSSPAVCSSEEREILARLREDNNIGSQFSPQELIDSSIPLKSLTGRIKAFQHSITGEVLFLVDKDITQSGLCSGVEYQNWFEVDISTLQSKYLKSVRTSISINNDNEFSKSKMLRASQEEPKNTSVDSTVLGSLVDSEDKSGSLFSSSTHSVYRPSPRVGAGTPMNPQLSGTYPILEYGSKQNSGSAIQLPETIEDIKPARVYSCNKLMEFVYHPPIKLQPLCSDSGTSKSANDCDAKSGRSDSNCHDNKSYRGKQAKGEHDVDISSFESSVSIFCCSYCAKSFHVLSVDFTPDLCSRSIELRELIASKGYYTASNFSRHEAVCKAIYMMKNQFSPIDEEILQSVTNLNNSGKSVQNSLKDVNSYFQKVEIFRSSLIKCAVRCKNSVNYMNHSLKTVQEVACELDNLVAKMRDVSGQMREFTRDQDDLASPLISIVESSAGILDNLLSEALNLRKKAADKLRIIKECSDCLTVQPSDYHLIKPLCKGSFATVYLCRSIRNSGIYALKVMSKAHILRENCAFRVINERHVLTDLSSESEYFSHLYCAFTTSSHLFMTLDFAAGGDCLTMLSKYGTLPERMVKVVIAELVCAVKCLHAHNVVHRDIKPDNVLITANGHVKLADFGMACMRAHLGSITNGRSLDSGDVSNSRHSASDSFQSGSSLSITFQKVSANVALMKTPVGNFNYAPPEAITMCGYDHSVDWWSLGVLFFHFLTGRTPFEGSSVDDTLENIVRAEINWKYLNNYGKPPGSFESGLCSPRSCNSSNHSSDNMPVDLDNPYDPISPGCLKLISEMLQELPRDRLGYASADEIMMHSYFSDLTVCEVDHPGGSARSDERSEARKHLFCFDYYSPGPITLMLKSQLDTSYFDYFTWDDPEYLFLPDFGFVVEDDGKTPRNEDRLAKSSTRNEWPDSYSNFEEFVHNDFP